MCDKCKSDKCKSTSCFGISEPVCDKGCDDVLSSDCIFLAMLPGSKKLYNIGITEGVSLSRAFEKLDDKLSLLLTSDFSKFEMNGLNTKNKIGNIKEFVFHITKKVKELENVDYSELIEALDEDVENLTKQIQELNVLGISNSKLNINSIDTLDVVIEKLIEAINNIKVSEFKIVSSSSVKFSQFGSSTTAEVMLSEEEGNILSLQEDGLFAAHLSSTELLNAIKDNTKLKASFKQLVDLSFPSLCFDIMSNTTQIIKYINILGDEVPATAKANTLLKITDAKRIVSMPSTSLTITFKGIL